MTDQRQPASKLDQLGNTAELEESKSSSQQQMLEEILLLKRNGDEQWKEKLAAFKQLYPDFSLPEELQIRE